MSRPIRPSSRVRARPAPSRPLYLPTWYPAVAMRAQAMRATMNTISAPFLARLDARGGAGVDPFSLRSRGHELSGMLADHHDRGVRVAAGDGGHDRRVGDPEPVDAADLEGRIDHGALVGAHAAGADGVVHGCGAVGELAGQRGPVRVGGAGAQLQADLAGDDLAGHDRADE